MHAFSAPPTQYEIESWVFPHPGVRRLQNANNQQGPQRHSLHSVTPLMKANKEREESARLKKGHRRWHSNEHQLLRGVLHRSKQNESKGESTRTGNLKTMLEWSQPLGDRSGSPTQCVEEEAIQRDRPPLGPRLSGCSGGHIQGDGAVVGKGGTKGDSKQGNLEPKHHSSALRVPPEGESRRRGGSKTSQHRRCHSQGHLYSMLAAEVLVQKEAEAPCRGSGSVRSRRGMSQSQLCESPYGNPFQTVSHRRARSSDVGAIPSELLGASVSPSHRLHKQPWSQELSPQLPSSGHASHAATTTQTQQHLQPTTSNFHRSPAEALEFHSTDLKALLRSLSCRSWNMGFEPGPSGGACEFHFVVHFVIQRLAATRRASHPAPAWQSNCAQLTGIIAVSWNKSRDRQGSFEDRCARRSSHKQDAAESDTEEEPNPTFLGSLDYHNFLHSSKAKVPPSPNTSPHPGTAVTPRSRKFNKVEAALGDFNAPSIVLKNKSTHESPVSKLAHKVTHSSSRKASPETM